MTESELFRKIKDFTIVAKKYKSKKKIQSDEIKSNKNHIFGYTFTALLYCIGIHLLYDSVK